MMSLDHIMFQRYKLGHMQKEWNLDYSCHLLIGMHFDNDKCENYADIFSK